MFISPLFFLFYFIMFLSIYFIGIIFLTKSRRSYLGSILPIIFLGISIYNFLKPILVYNPYPTMKEGMYMTFFGGLSIIGFIIYGIIRYRNKGNNKKDFIGEDKQ